MGNCSKILGSLAILASGFFLTACGGGGGGSSSSSSSSSSFNTTEFQANYGLAKINALTPYDNSGTGSGITVAVIDSGIDLTHSDLTGNTSANSASTTTSSEANLLVMSMLPICRQRSVQTNAVTLPNQ